MPSLDHFARQKLAQAAEKHMRRALQESQSLEGVEVLQNGKLLVSFSGNDYFNLSQHPLVKQAAIDAITRFGTGAGASRLVTGNHPLYAALERALATAKQTEASLVFGSGYLANLGVITALAGKGDLILADRLVHACMIDGARLSGAKLMRFSHNDTVQCAALLVRHRKDFRHCLILTETVFSMDGDRAPLAELLALAEHHDSWLLADDAHGLGIVPTLSSPSLVYTGTLSKGLGSYGGYAACSKDVMEYLVNTARSFIFTTGLPPSVIAAAGAALEMLGDSLTRQALENARYFTSLLSLPEAQSPIVPLILGEARKALEMSAYLREQGFLVSAIRPPTVPEGTARLRFTFSAGHRREDIRRLAEAVLAGVL